MGCYAPEERLRAITIRLHLLQYVATDVIQLVYEQGSLLEQDQADPALVQRVPDMNEDTGFIADGSAGVSAYNKSCSFW